MTGMAFIVETKETQAMLEESRGIFRKVEESEGTDE